MKESGAFGRHSGRFGQGLDISGNPRRYHGEPRAESREPRAESREPRAESREPRAESREPRAESRVGFGGVVRPCREPRVVARVDLDRVPGSREPSPPCLSAASVSRGGPRAGSRDSARSPRAELALADCGSRPRGATGVGATARFRDRFRRARRRRGTPALPDPQTVRAAELSPRPLRRVLAAEGERRCAFGLRLASWPSPGPPQRPGAESNTPTSIWSADAPFASGAKRERSPRATSARHRAAACAAPRRQ